ncbi:2-phosphosulfolactate phosphatase [Flammeovirga kamogawensis]|uniref:Probable 2-phosphosulfolactate phosphatase n=1 Tax=Flammeovirga kamogawensis TaxID=373891 RepID=A0ABX8GYS7_9BACT|nr:2-phosphosulfolactate phosphatase [Flammeovirga kamogawensis]MBB6458994.1 2-phosphosulfolactate phosphatase [Flammeovirga kamogawensis]QWG08568.1 2-phosphosulfolactate phosphatase [Flammeovirga kamogawensis]TRX66860.1 2-phosphosulfolactate phosphatase [Flammeovirga kamogawensis]
MKIETCLTPELISLHKLEGKIAVVTDVLRATSCMVAGLHAGVKSVIPVMTVEEALAYAKKGFVTAGERGGVKVDEFTIGNSPFEHMREEYNGKDICMTTTNGTVAITEAKKSADQVVIGAMLNVSTVADYILKQGKDIAIICAGWKGNPSLEDTLFAGALIDRIIDKGEIIDDASFMALTQYRAAKGNVDKVIQENASHAKRLSGLKAKSDLAYCATEDSCNVLPILKDDAITI